MAGKVAERRAALRENFNRGTDDCAKRIVGPKGA